MTTTSLPAVSKGTSAPTRRLILWSKRVTPTRVHWLSLIFAAVILVWINRSQWFSLDEWNFLVDRSLSPKGDDLGIFAGHNEHWSTITVLGYRILFKLFAVRTYAPYMAVMIIFHIAICHLLWRFLLKVGTQIWTATAAIAIFAVLGAGWENLTQAFQWSLSAPLLFGIGALILIHDNGRPRRNDVIAAGLLVLGIGTSGVGITVVIIVAIALVLRRRFKALFVVAGPAAFIYAVWYTAIGRTEASPEFVQPITTAVQSIPAYVWRGLTEAADLSTGLTGIGAAVIIGLAIFAVRRAHPFEEPWPLILAPAAGAIIFLALTALKRSGLGIGTAGSSRYIYLVVALLLPLATLTFDYITMGKKLRPFILVLLTLTLLLTQISTLRSEAIKTAGQEQLDKRRLLATAELAKKNTSFLIAIPEPTYAPNVSADELAVLLRNGDLPGNVSLSTQDFLDARLWTQVALGDIALVNGPIPIITSTESVVLTADTDGCFVARPSSPSPKVTLHFDQPSSFSLQSPLGGSLFVTAQASGSRAIRPFVLNAGQQQFLSVGWSASRLTITLPFSSDSRLCGLTQPAQ